MNWMHRFGSVAIFIFGLGTAYAARDFTPQSGTWIITSELDGKPGRGMAIDVQGNTLFMQVFGYDQDGSATFYTATGELTSHSMTAPLVHYRGGRYFGSNPQIAQTAGAAGTVTLNFDNGLAGTIQFPGEPPRLMQRLLVQDTEPGYQGIFSNAKDRYGNFNYSRRMTWVARGQGLQHGWNVTLRRISETNYALQLWDNKVIWYQPGRSNQPETLRPKLDMDCTLDGTTQVFNCNRLPIAPVTHHDSYTNFSATEDINLPLQTARFRTIGNDVVGWAMSDGAEPQALELMGLAGDTSQGDCGVAPPMKQHFVQPNVNYLCNVRPVPPNATAYKAIPTLMPTNGTWVVEEELNGKPGRGIALDVQDTQMIAQVFNYLPNGNPTFHMASGRFLADADSDSNSVGQALLHQYAGGTPLGGGHRSAQPVASPGTLRLEIDGFKGPDGNIAKRYDYFSAGLVQFPGETLKRVRRLALEPQDTAVDLLTGTWFLEWLSGDNSHFLQTFTDLTRATNGEGNEIESSDGEVVCGVPPNAPNAGCSWKKMRGRMVYIKLLTFGRSSSLQVRDRHGNWKGLGAVQLPGLDMPSIPYLVSNQGKTTRLPTQPGADMSAVCKAKGNNASTTKLGDNPHDEFCRVSPPID